MREQRQQRRRTDDLNGDHVSDAILIAIITLAVGIVLTAAYCIFAKGV